MSTSPEDVERLEQIEDAETANLEVEEKAEVEEADGSIPEADEHRELEADGEKVRATTPKTNVLETDGHVVTTEANSSEDDEFQFDLSTAGVPIPDQGGLAAADHKVPGTGVRDLDSATGNQNKTPQQQPPPLTTSPIPHPITPSHPNSDDDSDGGGVGELEGDQTHQLEPHHHLVPLEDSELEEKQVDVPVVPPSSEEDSVPAEDSSVSATAELANDCGITNTKAPAPIAIENDVDAVTSISHKRPSPRVPEEALDHLLGPEVSIVQKDQKEPELLELDSATFTQVLLRPGRDNNGNDASSIKVNVDVAVEDNYKERDKEYWEKERRRAAKAARRATAPQNDAIELIDRPSLLHGNGSGSTDLLQTRNPLELPVLDKNATSFPVFRQHLPPYPRFGPPESDIGTIEAPATSALPRSKSASKPVSKPVSKPKSARMATSATFKMNEADESYGPDEALPPSAEECMAMAAAEAEAEQEQEQAQDYTGPGHYGSTMSSPPLAPPLASSPSISEVDYRQRPVGVIYAPNMFNDFQDRRHSNQYLSSSYPNEYADQNQNRYSFQSSHSNPNPYIHYGPEDLALDELPPPPPQPFDVHPSVSPIPFDRPLSRAPSVIPPKDIYGYHGPAVYKPPVPPVPPIPTSEEKKSKHRHRDNNRDKVDDKKDKSSKDKKDKHKSKDKGKDKDKDKAKDKHKDKKDKHKDKDKEKEKSHKRSEKKEKERGKEKEKEKRHKSKGLAEGRNNVVPSVLPVAPTRPIPPIRPGPPPAPPLPPTQFSPNQAETDKQHIHRVPIPNQDMYPPVSLLPQPEEKKHKHQHSVDPSHHHHHHHHHVHHHRSGGEAIDQEKKEKDKKKVKLRTPAEEAERKKRKQEKKDKEMREKAESKPKGPDVKPEKSSSKSKDKEKEKEKEKKREKGANEGKEKGAEKRNTLKKKERSKSKDKDKDRDKEKTKSKDKDRDRDKEHKDRDKDKEREHKSSRHHRSKDRGETDEERRLRKEAKRQKKLETYAKDGINTMTTTAVGGVPLVIIHDLNDHSPEELPAELPAEQRPVSPIPEPPPVPVPPASPPEEEPSLAEAPLEDAPHEGIPFEEVPVESGPPEDTLLEQPPPHEDAPLDEPPEGVERTPSPLQDLQDISRGEADAPVDDSEEPETTVNEEEATAEDGQETLLGTVLTPIQEESERAPTTAGQEFIEAAESLPALSTPVPEQTDAIANKIEHLPTPTPTRPVTPTPGGQAFAETDAQFPEVRRSYEEKIVLTPEETALNASAKKRTRSKREGPVAVESKEERRRRRNERAAEEEAYAALPPPPPPPAPIVFPEDAQEARRRNRSHRSEEDKRLRREARRVERYSNGEQLPIKNKNRHPYDAPNQQPAPSHSTLQFYPGSQPYYDNRPLPQPSHWAGAGIRRGSANELTAYQEMRSGTPMGLHVPPPQHQPGYGHYGYGLEPESPVQAKPRRPRHQKSVTIDEGARDEGAGYIRDGKERERERERVERLEKPEKEKPKEPGKHGGSKFGIFSLKRSFSKLFSNRDKLPS